MILLMVSLACASILLVVAGGRFVRVAIALYEALNLPNARPMTLTPAGLAQAARTFLTETIGTIALLGAAPLGWAPSPVVPPLTPGTPPPVVLVPDRHTPRVGFWLLRRRLRRDGWPHATTVRFPFRLEGLLAAARHLRGPIERLAAHGHAAGVILIGHGVGGVVCRAYLRHLDGAARVAKVVTLASPHQGSKLFALSLDPLLRDVQDGSATLADLAADDPVPDAVDFTAIYSTFDTMVVPARNGFYPGASNIEIEDVGHLAFLWSRRAYELIRETLVYARKPPSAS